MNSVTADFCKLDYENPEDGKLWFVNVSLLHDEIFQKVIEDLLNFNLSKPEVLKIMAITIIYMKYDLELVAHKLTPLIKDALQKRFTFISKLTEIYPITNTFICSEIIKDTLTLINNIKSLDLSKFQTEWFDKYESLNTSLLKVINQFEELIYTCQQNFWLSRWLSINGFVKYELSILYHCFFIPIIPVIYLKQFSRNNDETVTEKIEYNCFCKLSITEKVPIPYQNQYYMVECILDPFKGRYLGLLDMVNYIAKQINPMRYEIKHSITLAKISDKIENFNGFKNMSIQLSKSGKCKPTN